LACCAAAFVTLPDPDEVTRSLSKVALSAREAAAERGHRKRNRDLAIKIIFIALTIVPFGSGLYLLQWAIASAIALCCWLLLWPIWVGFLSHAYRQLVPVT